MEWHEVNKLAMKKVAEAAAAAAERTAEAAKKAGEAAAAAAERTSEHHRKFMERGKQLAGMEAARKKDSDAAWMEKNAAAERAVKQHTAEAAKKFASEAPEAP